MIAPSRQTQESPGPYGLRRARRFVATMLLERTSDPTQTVPAIPAWKAWLLAAWAVASIAAYAAHLIGWI